MEVLAKARQDKSKSAKADSGSGGSSSGNRNGSEANGEMVMLRTLVPVVLAHERAVHELQDRSSFVIILFDEDLKNEVVELREVWRKEDGGRKKENDESKKKAKEEEKLQEWKPKPHTMGSQKSLVAKFLIQKTAAAMGSDNPLKSTVAQLGDKDTGFFDDNIFRLKPKFQDPVEGKAWVWEALYSNFPHEDFVKAIRSMQSASFVGIAYKKQSSIDGPNIRWLMEQLPKQDKPAKGKGKGKGKNKGKKKSAAVGGDSMEDASGNRRKREEEDDDYL